MGFLPLANWIPGGPEAPWFGAVARDGLQSTAIAAGIALLLVLLARRIPGLWREGALEATGASFASQGGVWILAIAGAALLLYGLTAWLVFSGKPLLIDEIVQVWQGRLLTHGRLWIPAAAHPEFFSSLHIVEQDGRVYGQFPIGGPAMLALGSLVHAEWLVGPVFGALAVAGFGVLMRRIEPRPLVGLGATLLFALAPFAVFMSGSHMNHVTALGWLVWGMVGLVGATARTGTIVAGLLCGLCLGLAATIRPIDALAFALPAAGWLLIAAKQQRRLGPLLGAGGGILIPLLLLGLANRATTGSPFQFGYSVLWGAGHGLGFHVPPWGEPHTPLRGFQLINLYLLRLQTYLFESGIPSLLPATVALALTRRLSGFDRYLLVASGLVVGLYFAYWHDGFYLGPRFMYPLLPVLVLWTARAIGAIRSRLGGESDLTRMAIVTGLVAIALSLCVGVPERLGQYRAGMLSLRWDADRAAERAGVHDALVLVRESWGAELIARLWALGITRPQADAVYRTIDPCRLDAAISTLEERGARRDDAMAVLAPLQADSSRLVTAPELTGDPSLRVEVGAHYSEACVGKLRQNQNGFTLFAPLLLARRRQPVCPRSGRPRQSPASRLSRTRHLPPQAAVGRGWSHAGVPAARPRFAPCGLAARAGELILPGATTPKPTGSRKDQPTSPDPSTALRR